MNHRLCTNQKDTLRSLVQFQKLFCSQLSYLYCSTTTRHFRTCITFVKMVKYLNRESGYVQIEVMSHYFMRRRNRLFFIYSFKSSECLLTQNRKTKITIKITIKFMVLRYYYLNNINTCKMCKWLILDFRWQIKCRHSNAKNHQSTLQVHHSIFRLGYS